MDAETSPGRGLTFDHLLPLAHADAAPPNLIVIGREPNRARAHPPRLERRQTARSLTLDQAEPADGTDR